jgi:8-oxo-dGTP pyrophosphatase MutT (NUDIX family)
MPNAATLAATYPTQSGARIILIRRPDTMRRHPGQIAFPGGMIEPADPDPFAAALREAREEVGLRIPPTCAAIPLAPVATLSTGVVIQPYWVHLAASPRLRAQPDEVAAVLRVPIRDLQRPDTLTTVPHPRRPGVEVPAYCWHGEVIWGATFQSLAELLDRLSAAGIS